ncbi:homeotic protein female sterile [Anopheles moucheti]|uniref:homeotic protein female sterile n=1 Tax=Anopheles moucheti TaxID=186751 RepID=UPI0022F01C6F|nr:homeotic protein female sterile [Anopheles moucheti]
MNSGSDFGTAIRQNSSPKHDFPLQNGPSHPVEYQNYIGTAGGGAGAGGGGGVGMQNHQAQQQDLTIDGIPNNFPHRRSRASRTFKNPPQPHMCIKERTVDGKEVFINVLSWTRIANPDNPDAPIPLYGGMKVGKIPPGSPKVPPLVYAVMASPEVLKKAGRKCPDTPERMNLVDLMCEFVEAMNPSLHLSRKPEILKDRDLSGELKDVWSAVQACRDKGRSDNGPPENLVVYTEFGPDSAPSYEQTIQQHQQQQQHQHHLQYQQQYEQLPNSHEQQGRFPLSVGSTGQQQQQQHYPYHHQQQSAINLNNHSNSSILTSIEQQISAISVTDGIEGTIGTNGITPTTANGPSNNDEMLTKETESLKLSSSNGSSSGTVSKTNGITLPNADAIANTAPPMTSSSSPTVPQTSPTNSTPVMPAKEPTKSSSGHNFFPMFRSSKSSNSSSSSASSIAANSSSTGGNNSAANNAQLSSGTGSGGDKPAVNGGGSSESMASSNASSDNGTSEPPKATKTSSKKSGLNFFRRNKSTTDGGGSKKEPSTPTKQSPAAGVLPAGISSATSGPATPAATGAASTGPEAKLQTLMDNDAISHGNHRGHQNHPYHLDSGSNGNGGGGGGGDSGNGGEILETSTATIAAK